jgi:hypothetical protein
LRSITLPRGKLSVLEEFPGAVFEAVDPFLRQ